MSVHGRQTDGEEDDDDGLSTVAEVREQVNLVEHVMDFLDSDNDWLAALVANQVQMARLERSQAGLLRDIRDQQAPDIVGEFPFELSHDVPADTPTNSPNVVTRTPSDESETRIVSLSLGWPDGANNQVGIKVRTGNGLTLFPRNPQDDFVAFNDFSETFGLDYRLNPGEELIAETVNLDTQNNHFVNIVPQIVELEDEGGD